MIKKNRSTAVTKRLCTAWRSSLTTMGFSASSRRSKKPGDFIIDPDRRWTQCGGKFENLPDDPRLATKNGKFSNLPPQRSSASAVLLYFALGDVHEDLFEVGP